jgi:hypothetical protein
MYLLNLLVSLLVFLLLIFCSLKSKIKSINGTTIFFLLKKGRKYFSGIHLTLESSMLPGC